VGVSDIDPGAGRPQLSVVIAAYNRADSVTELLRLFAEQTLPAAEFEVIVVDDGSAIPVAPLLERLVLPFSLTVLRQANAGPAAARNTGILQARGRIIVILDDDMRIGPEFLAAHLACHDVAPHRVVLGRLLPPAERRLPLFERMQLDLLDRMAARAANGGRLRGGDLYTGNVSFLKTDYLDVGGFDPALRLSEDLELGLRLDERGAEFVLSNDAWARHESDHASLKKWMRRSVTYGSNDLHLAQKHPDLRSASPWRFVLQVNPISRPFLLFAALAPNLSAAIAWTAMWVSMALGGLGLERVALFGGTFAYGVQYFRGVRRGLGSLRVAMSDFGRYLSGCDGPELGFVLRWGKMLADIREDHVALCRADEKYKSGAPRRHNIVGDAIQRIGFQMIVAYRVMRYFRDARPRFVAKIASRMIRHVYGADIHWDARIDPGVIFVHGSGLIISPASIVSRGCVLFQHVTLGESIDAESRRSGSPMLEPDVHVGPGTTLLGPITIGQGTKITANVLLMRSVGPRSLVEAAAPTIRTRKGAEKARTPQSPPDIHEQELAESSPSERSTSHHG
jgi:serine acetyltransferase/glycosyltransferase involved in cell wall biosynthesis